MRLMCVIAAVCVKNYENIAENVLKTFDI